VKHIPTRPLYCLYSSKKSGKNVEIFLKPFLVIEDNDRKQWEIEISVPSTVQMNVWVHETDAAGKEGLCMGVMECTLKNECMAHYDIFYL